MAQSSEVLKTVTRRIEVRTSLTEA